MPPAAGGAKKYLPRRVAKRNKAAARKAYKKQTIKKQQNLWCPVKQEKEPLRVVHRKYAPVRYAIPESAECRKTAH